MATSKKSYYDYGLIVNSFLDFAMLFPSFAKSNLESVFDFWKPIRAEEEIYAATGNYIGLHGLIRLASGLNPSNVVVRRLSNVSYILEFAWALYRVVVGKNTAAQLRPMLILPFLMFVWGRFDKKNKQNKWTLYKDNEDDDYWNIKKLDNTVPGHDYGHGRIELTNVLCFDSNIYCTNGGLWLTGSAFSDCDDYSHDECLENDNSQRGIYHEIQSEGQTVEFSFPIITDEISTNIRATLVWSDDVYSTSRNGGLLVNTLDMTLFEELSNGTQRFYEPLESTLGYTPSSTWTINHSPRVGAKYQLLVSGTVIVSTQPFAVVVSGFNATFVTDKVTDTSSTWGAMPNNFFVKMHELMVHQLEQQSFRINLQSLVIDKLRPHQTIQASHDVAPSLLVGKNQL